MSAVLKIVKRKPLKRMSARECCREIVSLMYAQGATNEKLSENEEYLVCGSGMRHVYRLAKIGSR